MRLRVERSPDCSRGRWAASVERDVGEGASVHVGSASTAATEVQQTWAVWLPSPRARLSAFAPVIVIPESDFLWLGRATVYKVRRQ